MKRRIGKGRVTGLAVVAIAATLAASGGIGVAQSNKTSAAPPASAAVTTLEGMPQVPDPRNLYSEATAEKIAPALRGDLERIYVPNLRSNDVVVVDPATLKVVDRFKVGIGPQHIVPAWDLRTLWVTNNAEGRTDGSLTPVDPKTGKPGKAVP